MQYLFLLLWDSEATQRRLFIALAYFIPQLAVNRRTILVFSSVFCLITSTATFFFPFIYLFIHLSLRQCSFILTHSPKSLCLPHRPLCPCLPASPFTSVHLYGSISLSPDVSCLSFVGRVSLWWAPAGIQSTVLAFSSKQLLFCSNKEREWGTAEGR